MSDPTFAKTLSANDVGLTGGHQAGILVPKSEDLLGFFPYLDPALSNPDAWIICEDEDGREWRLRYIYYNNRLHGTGTRNEYRLTHLTRYLRDAAARPGDSLVFVATEIDRRYRMSLQRSGGTEEAAEPGVIRLSGWRRIH